MCKIVDLSRRSMFILTTDALAGDAKFRGRSYTTVVCN